MASNDLEESDVQFKTINDAANHIFEMSLDMLSFTVKDARPRESFLLSFPIHLKSIQGGSGKKRLENAVLYPFGSYYHGIGFKDDPITAYLDVGEPLFNSEDEAISRDELTETRGFETTAGTTGNKSNAFARKNMLLDISAALKRHGGGRSAKAGTYEDVSFAPQGNLSFTFRNSEGSSDQFQIILQAKSFLPVQNSRLIKFYCILERIFFPFVQSLVQWAGCMGVIEFPRNHESSGLKLEHFLLLLIFFLVRKRIIPSFYLLKKWSDLEFIVDGINVGFCENDEKVREKCLDLGIGPDDYRPDQILERILQLQCEFFLEISTFDFVEFGISPATGKTFSKYLNQQLNVHENHKAFLYIQDVLDRCQNVTREVDQRWGLKLKEKCKVAADKLFPLVWKGDLYNSTLAVIDMDHSKKKRGRTEITDGIVQLVLSKIDCSSNLTKDQRDQPMIKFRVRPDFLEVLSHAYSLGGMENEGEVQIKRLFFKILQEFNGVFWRRLLAAKTVIMNVEEAKYYLDPVIFPTLRSISDQLKSRTSIDVKVVHFLSSMSSMLQEDLNECCGSDDALLFCVQEDWTKAPADDILSKKDMNRKDALCIVKSLLEGFENPRTIYGARPKSPKRPKLLVAVMLDAHYEEGGLYLYSSAKMYDTLDEDEGRKVNHYLNWYKALVETYVKKRFVQWIGNEMLDDLAESKENEKKRKSIASSTSSTKENLQLDDGINANDVAEEGNVVPVPYNHVDFLSGIQAQKLATVSGPSVTMVDEDPESDIMEDTSVNIYQPYTKFSTPGTSYSVLGRLGPIRRGRPARTRGCNPNPVRGRGRGRGRGLNRSWYRQF